MSEVSASEKVFETIDTTPCPSALEDRGMRDVSTSNNQSVVAGSLAANAKELQQARLHLGALDARGRLLWAYERFGSGFALTTSFGIQSAVLLHLLNGMDRGREVPVIWVDTGYLPPETYRYAEDLRQRFELNLHITQSSMSAARMEALHGRLWESGSVEDMEHYLKLRKVEPLEEAMHRLQVRCWASGVRRGQTDHRRNMTALDPIRGRSSLRPLLEWTSRDVFYYMQENDLPQHPLFEKGYSTVGDLHSSGPDGLEAEGRDTRFAGLKQECGIHLPGVMGDGI